jgi:hypothetical protein
VGRKNKFNEQDVLVVEWRDAHFDFDYTKTRDDYIVKTIGFLVSEGPVFLSVAQEILPDGDGYRGVTHIPLECVKTINGN